VEHAEVAELV